MPRVRNRKVIVGVSPYSLLGPTRMLSYIGVAAQHIRHLYTFRYKSILIYICIYICTYMIYIKMYDKQHYIVASERTN